MDRESRLVSARARLRLAYSLRNHWLDASKLFGAPVQGRPYWRAYAWRLCGVIRRLEGRTYGIQEVSYV